MGVVKGGRFRCCSPAEGVKKAKILIPRVEKNEGLWLLWDGRIQNAASTLLNVWGEAPSQALGNVINLYEGY